MKNKRGMLCLLISVLMLLSLTACGKGDKKSQFAHSGGV